MGYTLFMVFCFKQNMVRNLKKIPTGHELNQVHYKKFAIYIQIFTYESRSVCKVSITYGFKSVCKVSVTYGSKSVCKVSITYRFLHTDPDPYVK